jgi:hypothetical protein
MEPALVGKLLPHPERSVSDAKESKNQRQSEKVENRQRSSTRRQQVDKERQKLRDMISRKPLLSVVQLCGVLQIDLHFVCPKIQIAQGC